MKKRSCIAIGLLIVGMISILSIVRYYVPSNEESTEHLQGKQEQIEVQKQQFPRSHPTFLMYADIWLEEMASNRDAEVNEEANIEETTEEITSEEPANNYEQALEAVSIKNPKVIVTANAAVLMDATSRRVLYSKNSLEHIQPASTAKLLTAIVAVRNSDKDECYTVGSEIELIASDSSRAYLSKGQVLSMEQILDALLLPSGNDAAYVIAAHIGRKLSNDPNMKTKAAVKVFVQEMNDVAKELGVVESNFMTPDGYDEEGQYTTAYDLAIIASNSLNYKAICNSVKKEKARHILLSGQDVTWYNSNKLIKQGSGYYYKYAIGLKTGTSGDAGRCLISAAEKEKGRYVSVVMDATYEGRWQDSLDLLTYAIQQQ